MVLSDFDDFDRKQIWNIITKVCENGENSVLWGLEKVYDNVIFIQFLFIYISLFPHQVYPIYEKSLIVMIFGIFI